MLVRMVGVEPYLITIKSRVHSRFATFAYFVSLTLCIYYIIKRGICQQVFENSLIFFKGYLNFQAYYKFRGTYCPISTGDVTRIFIRVLLPYFPSLYYILIIPQYNKSVKRFLKNIRNYFSVVFATTNLYRVLLPSIGCFLLYSSFLPFATERMTEVLFAYQFPKPILSASS